MATYVLFNKKAGAKEDAESYKNIEQYFSGEINYLDVTAIEDFKGFIVGLDNDDSIIVSGGDGTLNRFINNFAGCEFEGDILYYPNGSGNDFAADFGKVKHDAPFKINEYIKNLPTVIVNGKTSRFINGVGYGIDGYCCEVGDKLKLESDKPVNYTAIAIKGLLFDYKPTDAKVTVDGKTKEYKKVWLAPTMYGKHYGGGMIPTPNQDRENKEKLSVMLFHGSNKLRTLMIFPSIFKGEHIKSQKFVEVLEGKEITVEFSSPRALQIDGETVLNVSKYTAKAPCLNK